METAHSRTVQRNAKKNVDWLGEKRNDLTSCMVKKKGSDLWGNWGMVNFKKGPAERLTKQVTVEGQNVPFETLLTAFCAM
jgi:hypothetical protein